MIMDTTTTSTAGTSSTSSVTARNKRRRITTEITDEAHIKTNHIIPPTGSIDIIDARQDITSSKYFYERYIALRKPCIIINANDPNIYGHDDDDDDTSTSNTTSQRIVKELLQHQETMVQVERRFSTQERFGQSRHDTKQQQRQVTMSISSFVKDICHIQESTSHHTTLKPNQTENIIINNSNDEPNETSDHASTSMLYYLSTQEEPSDETNNSNNINDVNDSKNNIDTSQQEHPFELRPPQPYYGPPCDLLHPKKLLPTLPQTILAGNLHLHSINLWMGYTPKLITPTTLSSSTTTTTASKSHNQNQRQQHSGLHFDYHDNFYTLLHGEKTFYLYPPHCAPYLVLQGGTINTIHTNGLISFAQTPVGADGRSLRQEHIHHHPKPAAIATPHTAKQNEDDSEEEEGDDEEEEEEVVLGKGYDYASSNDDGNEDGTDWHREDGNDHKDDYNDDDDDYSDDEVDDDKLINQHKNSKDTHDTNSQGNAKLSLEEMWLPPNFSWIDPIHTTREQIIQTFPVYAQCPIEFPYKVTLLPNQCLYLPASWLHCVISSGRSNTDDTDERNGNAAANTKTTIDDNAIHIPSAVHMAINYWYHPPDNLSNYDHPYTDRQYWERPFDTKDKK